MDITRGSLDDITRPAQSSRHRPGSRISLNSYGGYSSPVGNRPPSNTSSSMEILPPDPDILLQQDNDLALVEYLSSSEEENDDDVGGVSGNNLDNANKARDAAKQTGFEDRMHNLDLLLAKTQQSYGDSDDTGTIDTEDFCDQERFLEDRVKVLGSAPSPHAPRGGSRNGSRSNSRSASRSTSREQENQEQGEDPDADLAAIADPQLRKAIKKMRKLDRILNTKVTREKEVKRQRKILHHQLEVELDSIKEEGGGKSKDATENTSRYLSLVPPARHDEGVNVEDIPSTPVFSTQVLDGSPAHRPGGATAASSQHSSPRSPSKPDRRASKTSPRDGKNPRRPRPQRRGGAQAAGREDDGDFIQRNIELASDAGSLIAMTDDEKKRLEDLLLDVEILAGDPEEEGTGNKLQLNTHAGAGYTPDVDSQKMLQDIDEKLKNLLPSDDFSEICSTPSLMGDRRDSFNPDAFDLGEQLLRVTKDERSQHQRLQDIDLELAHLQNQVDKELSSPSLSKTQLNVLLQRCSDASDRTITEITSPRLAPSSQSQSDTSSPRSSSHLSPRTQGATPRAKLSDDTLQRLLSEAKEGLGLLALENAADSRASGSRASTALSPGRESAQLALSLGDTPRSEMTISTSRDTSRSLVSHDMIQQLLRNPRATMLQSSQLGNGAPDSDSDGEGEG